MKWYHNWQILLCLMALGMVLVPVIYLTVPLWLIEYVCFIVAVPIYLFIAIRHLFKKKT